MDAGIRLRMADLYEKLGAPFKAAEEYRRALTADPRNAEAKKRLDNLLSKTLAYYLAHPDEARGIGERARKRALAEHTLRHRIEEMLAILR